MSLYSRRHFIKTTAKAAGAALCSPLSFPGRVLSAEEPLKLGYLPSYRRHPFACGV